ncbi:MAG: Flp family type IVb pilin [Gammaproteobacteria bacterium]|nr:Flp family type IVb pilin [Gammaproteobacteria bacterium]NNF59862.1 Flp family type IVb pilin [Gammaproteobacteria bacterium]NNM21497.1 Flp family type IVb pilin [Gammaproteobacteria bacterium]
MATLKSKIFAFLRDEEGLTTVEYAIAGGLVGAGAILAFSNLGGEVARVIGDMFTALETVTIDTGGGTAP